MFGPPPSPPTPPKPGSRPAPAPLVSVVDEPDDPTRLMDRRSPAERAAEHAAIFNSPTKILPRVRSGGVLGSIGANLIAYTQKPSVNLVLLLLAGSLLVGLGFVLGTARKEPAAPALTEPSSNVAIPVPTVRPVSLPTASAPVAAIAVSSLPLAPPRDLGSNVRANPGSSATRAGTPDFPLPRDHPPATGEKTFVPPVRNPGF